MFNKSVIFLLMLFSFNFLNAKESFYFMPQDSSRAIKEIINSIKYAKKDIKCSIYSFTRKDFAKALANAAKRGVKVEIIFDWETNTERKRSRSRLRYLAKYKNIDIYIARGKISKNGKYYGKLHAKVMIIDQKRVIFGSANWSKSAFSQNYEVVSIVDDYAVAKKFIKYFERIKSKAKRYR